MIVGYLGRGLEFRDVFCRVCGSKMNVEIITEQRGFDDYTGKPDIQNYAKCRCPHRSHWARFGGSRYFGIKIAGDQIDIWGEREP